MLVPEVNIGLVGHVDTGKTSLTEALTGKWTDTHSEEKKRGITIRLGYADITFHKCEKCGKYSSTERCSGCFEEAKPVRAVSFLDAPGHETLMATVLSGASLMDGALLLIAADEDCPQPQTAEHLKVLDIVGIKNIVIVQNKIDLVTEERALKHYEQIKKFVQGTVAENAPIIPISAIHNVNIDMLIEAIENTISTPDHDLLKPAKFYVARSFDINKPGADISGLAGAVIGGSLTQGVLVQGDEIEIRPGVKTGEKWTSLTTKISKIVQSGHEIKEAKPGGLLAVQTELDPALSRGDGLAGSVVGHPDKLPDVRTDLRLKTSLFSEVMGMGGHHKVQQIKQGEPLLLTAAITKTVGVVLTSKKDEIVARLKIPVCADRGEKVAIAMQVGGRWHLIGYGVII